MKLRLPGRASYSPRTPIIARRLTGCSRVLIYKGVGRIRLKVIPDCSSMSLNTFIAENVEPGSTIVTDAWRSYQSI